MNKFVALLILYFCINTNSFSQVGLNSLVFNGTSDYYSVPDNSSIDLSGSFTIEAWINPCDTVNNVILSKHWCASAGGSYFLQILSGRLRWGWTPLGGCVSPHVNVYLSTSGIIRNNQWQHIAIVHTPTSVSFYYNGVLISGSMSLGNYSGVFNNNSEPLRIGAYRNLAGTLGVYYSGRMDEIRIWNTTLTSSQILSRKNLSLVGNESNLVLYHNFETDTNRIIHNKATSSGTTNNGLTNSLTPYFLSGFSKYPLAFSLGNDTLLCDSGNLILDAGNSTSSYLWDNSTTLRYRTINTSGIYSASIINKSCIVSDTISVTINNLSVNLGVDTLICNDISLLLDATTPGCSYTWNNGDTTSTYSATYSGNHWVTITDVVCSYSDTINVAFDSVDLVFMNDTTICMNDSLVLSTTTTATNFLWSTGEITPSIIVKTAGIYWVEVTNGGCTIRDSMELFISNMSFSLGNDTVICSNNQLVLNANRPGSTYLWNTGSTNSSINVNTTGLYFVTVTNKGCSEKDSIYIGVQEVLSSFTISDSNGCEPVSISFTDLSSVNFGNVNSWSWNFGDGTNSILQNPLKTFSTAGNFTVSLNVVSNYGCSDDTIINSLINVFPKPNAIFTTTGSRFLTDELINFNNTSTLANSYLWNFGDGGNSTLTNPTYSYSNPRIYSVKLVANNLFNCKDSIIKNIEIIEDNKVFFPNSFTPNNDDLNEVWRIYGLQEASSVEVLIFNRWGEIIYESNSLTEGWDGTHEGENVPIGIYPYLIRYKTFGIVKKHSGHINLIR